MTKQTPHSRMQDASNFIMAAIFLLILAMLFNSCSSERRGCTLTKGLVGYSPYR